MKHVLWIQFYFIAIKLNFKPFCISVVTVQTIDSIPRLFKNKIYLYNLIVLSFAFFYTHTSNFSMWTTVYLGLVKYTTQYTRDRNNNWIVKTSQHCAQYVGFYIDYDSFAVQVVVFVLTIDPFLLICLLFLQWGLKFWYTAYTKCNTKNLTIERSCFAEYKYLKR